MEVCRYTGKSAFLSAFRRLHLIEAEPVLMILDWQDVPRCLISKAGVSGKLFRLAGYVAALDSERNRAFHLWLEERWAVLSNRRSNEIIGLFEASYRGCFPKKGAFGQYHAQQMLAIHDPQFDYARFEAYLFTGEFIRIGKYVFSR